MAPSNLPPPPLLVCETRPRQYAAEILRIPTREARAAALAEVPEEYREMVKRYVEAAFARGKR